MSREHPVDEGDDCRIGMLCVASPFEHTRIAAFEAEGEHVKCHIGARFIDDTDYSERHADTSQKQSVGECAAFDLLA